MSYQKVYMNQIYSSSIMRQVAQMWKNQLLCDAVIKTGNVHTKAHRLVLIAACPMLQDTENASVGSHLEVRLNSDISESSVKIFLQYLYEGYMMLTEENCRDVEKIAKMLHVDSITKCCTDFQKCLNAKMGYSSSQKLNFDLQDSADFRFVNTTDLQKTVPEGQQKRQNEMISGNTASKRPRFQSSSYTSHRPDDHLSMNDSYNSVRNSNQKEKEGIIDISEQSVELINIGPGARDSDGWPINTDLPPIRTSSSVSVANKQERETDVQIVNVQPARVDRAPLQPSQQGSTSTFGRHQDPRSSTIVAGQSQGIPERPSIVPSHSPKSSRRPDESPQYMSSNIPQLSPLSSTSPKSVQKHRETDDHDRPFALGSAPTGSRSFSLPSSSTIHPVDVVKNTSLYESQKFTTDNTNQNSMMMETGNKRTSASPDPIIVKLEDDTTESGDIELYIQNPQNDSFSTDPGDPGGESQSELDPDMSNDGSMSMEPEPWQQQEGQTQGSLQVITQGLQCHFCQEKFPRLQDLSLHLREKENFTKNIQYCLHCNLVFYSTPIYQNHIFAEHSDNKNFCPICKIAIKYACNFRRHVLSHFVEKPFLCVKCGCCFKRKDNLKKHQQNQNCTKLEKCSKTQPLIF